jgi:hypothetical protein
MPQLSLTWALPLPQGEGLNFTGCSVTPEYLINQDWKIAQGSAFTSEDNTSANNVAILGQTVATNLFPNGQSPIGQLVRIRNVPFTVIGVPLGEALSRDEGAFR